MSSREIQIPVEAQGFINELREQVAVLSERCASKSAEIAGLQAENAALKQALASKEQPEKDPDAAK